MTNEIELRPAVRRFAELMELRLRSNDRKGGWRSCSTRHLLRRLYDELQELGEMVYTGGITDVGNEAADVANFCMMISDNLCEGATDD